EDVRSGLGQPELAAHHRSLQSRWHEVVPGRTRQRRPGSVRKPQDQPRPDEGHGPELIGCMHEAPSRRVQRMGTRLTWRRFRDALTVIMTGPLMTPAVNAWQSDLFPAGWSATPDKSFESDRTIADFSHAGYMQGDKPIPNQDDANVFNVVT